MPQQVTFAKLVRLTALLLQTVTMMLITTFQHPIETLQFLVCLTGLLL